MSPHREHCLSKPILPSIDRVTSSRQQRPPHPHPKVCFLLEARLAGGRSFRTTPTKAAEFPGAASLRFLKAAGLDATRSTTVANSAR
jgi:hypothetical protein